VQLEAVGPALFWLLAQLAWKWRLPTHSCMDGRGCSISHFYTVTRSKIMPALSTPSMKGWQRWAKLKDHLHFVVVRLSTDARAFADCTAVKRRDSVSTFSPLHSIHA
jgi:hypothetical protein